MYGRNNSAFSTSFGTNPNPFVPTSSGDLLTPSGKSLDQMYAELDAIRNKSVQSARNQRTVFSDIAEEMSTVSDDERAFIEGSKEYIALNQRYQAEFSLFLIEKFGAEYSSSKYAETPERILGLIKEKKEQYKNQFASNLNEIKESNKELINKNDELLKTNTELQKELARIKEKLGGIV